jgi:hypothetical protein
VEDVARLRKEIETLRKENTRFRAAVEAQFEEHRGIVTSQNENNHRLLEMIKDIKEEVDVDRVVKGSNYYSMDMVQSSVVTCGGVYCKDKNCLEHYTEEGDFRTWAQTDGAREGSRGKDGKNADKNKKKGKVADPEMSLRTHRIPGGYNGPGRGQN